MRRNAEDKCEAADADARTCEPACELGADLAPTSPELATNEPSNRGRFALGNRASMRTGLRSARVLAGEMPEQAEARAALGERQAAIVADLGGREAVSTLALGQIERHARLELVDAFLWENLQRLGPLTAKGKTRAALSAWLLVVDRLHRSALALGLERKQKPANPLDAVRRAVAEANK